VSVTDWKIVHGDALEEMRKIADFSVDAVITDPPYGIGFVYDGVREQWTTAASWWEWYAPHYQEMERVVKPGGLIASWFSGTYLRHAWDWFGDDVRIFVEAKNFVQMRPVVMQMAWQPIAMRWKAGSLPIRPDRQPCGFDWAVANSSRAVARPESRIHPCPRQLNVVVSLVERFVPPGSTILDPFCGSGTTVLAALRRDCRGLGIESEWEYVESARRRIETDAPLFTWRSIG